MAFPRQTAYLKFAYPFIFVLITLHAQVAKAGNPMPSLSSFIDSVRNGQADVLRGIYIQNVMAHPVIQQPPGSPVYVSSGEDDITQFGRAAEAGIIGLLAHNYLAGSSFSQITIGEEILLVHGDGRVEVFIVSDILRYQALDPHSPISEFRTLDGTNTFTAQELFQQVYRGDRHLTLQTCIESDGISSWGRLFIIAQPQK